MVKRLHERLTSTLPAYMVPSYLDILGALPTVPSGKADRKEQDTPLEAPPRPEPIRFSGRRIAAAGYVQGGAIYLLLLLITLPLSLVFGLHHGHISERTMFETGVTALALPRLPKTQAPT